MKHLAVALLVAFGLAACGGGKSSPSLPAGQHNLGHGVSVAVQNVLDPVPVEVPPALAKDIANPVQPGTRWVGVDVEYFNTTDHVVDMAMAYGRRLHTADGREAEGISPTFTTQDMPAVPSAIPPRSSARGWDVYQIPDGATPAKALFYAEIGDDPIVIDL